MVSRWYIKQCVSRKYPIFSYFYRFLAKYKKKRYNQSSSYLQNGHQGLDGGVYGLLTASNKICTDYISPDFNFCYRNRALQKNVISLIHHFCKKVIRVSVVVLTISWWYQTVLYMSRLMFFFCYFYPHRANKIFKNQIHHVCKKGHPGSPWWCSCSPDGINNIYRLYSAQCYICHLRHRGKKSFYTKFIMPAKTSSKFVFYTFRVWWCTWTPDSRNQA
jgi:hypothetical protein